MNKKTNRNIVYFLGIGATLFIMMAAMLWFFNAEKTVETAKSTPSPTTFETDLKTFKSSNVMDFTIRHSDSFVVTENAGSAILSSASGTIIIDQNGTNFNDIEEYLEDLSLKNKFDIKNKKSVVINGYKSIVGMISNEKYYFIFASGVVSSISTPNQELFSDLDQIAKSFQYTPN